MWWAKIGNLPAVLQDFDLVVYMDFDVYINDMAASFERLLELWGFTDNHDLLMALDPDLPYNYSDHASSNGTRIRIRNLNAGFFVVRNTPGMLAMLKDWFSYRDAVSNDQTAFNSHVRATIPADKLRILPCREANGGDPAAWNEEDPTCDGVHLQHAWKGKEWLEGKLREGLVGDVMRVVDVERRQGGLGGWR